MTKEKQLSRSRSLAAKVIYAAFQILKENGNEMQMRELVNEVEKRVELNEWDRARYEKSGYIRWQSILHFFSIDCVKAGFLLKKKGKWYLTPEGEEAITLGQIELLESATRAYRKWKAEQPEEIEEIESDIDEATTSMTFDEIEQIAMDGLENFIQKKNAYEFQDLIAALLRAMGYYTPFVAPKGKDGGIDIIAYQDPLGTESPRIQVQIKHRESSANVQEVRQLMGLLQKAGDVGIFVSSGGFTSDAKSTARTSHIHVELIDFARFISLWQDFYNKMVDEDKSLIPLTPIYFLAKDD